jgi:hypothetical protein
MGDKIKKKFILIIVNYSDNSIVSHGFGKTTLVGFKHFYITALAPYRLPPLGAKFCTFNSPSWAKSHPVFEPIATITWDGVIYVLHLKEMELR